MPTVELQVIGLNKLKFSEFARSLDNMSRPLGLAMRYLRTSIKRDARHGKQIGGGTFEPYSQSYREWLVRKGLAGGKKWLTLSGDMLDAMAIRVDRRVGSMGYFKRTKQSKKAGAHNFGRKDGRVPKREFFGWRPQYIRYINRRIMWPWMREQAVANGLDLRVSF